MAGCFLRFTRVEGVYCVDGDGKRYPLEFWTGWLQDSAGRIEPESAVSENRIHAWLTVHGLNDQKATELIEKARSESGKIVEM
jgi:hypothetical protein